MRALAGAIVVLAGAVMTGAGTVAHAMVTASGKPEDGSTVGVLFGGAVVSLVGFRAAYESV